MIALLFLASATGFLRATTATVNAQSHRTAKLASTNEDEASSAVDARLSSVLSATSSGAGDAGTSLISALNDSAPLVRGAAVSGLAYLQDKEAIPKIGELLEHDKNEFVRRQAAYALGELGDCAAIPYLLRALKDKHPGVVAAAIVAVGERPCRDAVPALAEGLRNKSSFIRGESAKELGINAGEAEVSVSELIRLLDKDSSNYVRRQASIALGLIGDSRALASLEATARSVDPYLAADASAAINAIENHSR